MILKKLLGNILMEMGAVSKQQIDEALRKQKILFKQHSIPEKLQRVNLVSEARRAMEINTESLLGKILTDMETITKEQLESALEEQMKMFEEKEGKGKLALNLDNGMFFFAKKDMENVFYIDTKLSIDKLREKFKKFRPHNMSIKQFYRVLKK